MNDAEFQKLLEISWQRPLRPDEEERLQTFLRWHPERQAAWDEEAGLSLLLQQAPVAPHVSSNFTARVLDRVEREERRREHPVRPSPWRWWLPRLAGIAVTAALVLMGARMLFPPGREVASDSWVEEVRIVSAIADIPNAETLRDFEAIQLLPPTELMDKVDMELLAALQ